MYPVISQGGWFVVRYPEDRSEEGSISPEGGAEGQHPVSEESAEEA